METRVLTLFDDEDFYPKEEPKKKPKKEPATKVIESVSITQEPELGNEMVNPEEHTTPAPEVEAEEAHDSIEEIIPAEQSAEQVRMDASNAIIDNSRNNAPEEEEHIENITTHAGHHSAEEQANNIPMEPLAVSPDQVTIIEEPISEVAEKEEQQPEINADDEALNKQILSELIQVDYASLIHRDYPFDMSNASVVDKTAVTPSKEQVLQDEGNEENDDVFEDIVPLPEWKLDKKYYTIGEVAHLFAVNTSHIRFWTNEFKLKPRTTRKGDRLYSPKDIAELRLIHHLVKEKKHTIKGAREKLKAGKNDVHKKLDLKDSLINLRDTLLKIKEQL